MNHGISQGTIHARIARLILELSSLIDVKDRDKIATIQRSSFSRIQIVPINFHMRTKAGFGCACIGTIKHFINVGPFNFAVRW